ncbi:VOC family protein [Neolewinella lacunae]|uniref:VOC family protein n=1 Tax=Neolewinella lacunae TaxID=1517758 RepID=A0A923TAU6_9BACT|nr:VOC family protein [Neolewinella lacunae]MBC6996849.1 VOC family protein [Neolewinella lacunae]MDN3633827.1 VOC family protein [Neolewinella lacunae]
MRFFPALCWLLIAGLFTACSPKAAVFGTTTGVYGASFDHFAINVEDVDASVAFYQKVLGLEEIYDGTEKENIRWLSLGNGMSLHIIESDRSEIRLHKGVHLSISVTSFDAFVQHLRDINLQFWSWQGVPMQTNDRPDGARQVYFKDLDGYWTEVNDARVIWQRAQNARP